MESRNKSRPPRSQLTAPVIGLLAPENRLPQLLDDVRKPVQVHGRLVLASAEARRSPWAQNIWENPAEIPIRSVSDAAAKLRDIQRNWVLYSFDHHRRARLIQDALPHITFRPLEMGSPVPRAPLGSWTLLDKDLLLASPRCSSPFPHGELHFNQNKTAPPSRAYLKLWELFTILETRPAAGARCLDAGASPGGWTWVLASCGASVLAVDRSPLSPPLMRHPLVQFRKGDAFAPEHDRDGPFDWIFSDVACYPEKLFDWVLQKCEAFPHARFICTIKFQRDTDSKIVRKFETIPSSRLLHLFHNKHELTWIRGL